TKQVYRLTTRLGRTIRATGNHKLLAFDGWRRLDDTFPGLRIAVPRALPGPDAVTLSHDELALVGQLVGSGRVTSEGRLRFETRSWRHAADIAALASAVCRKNIAVWTTRSGAHWVDVDPGRRWLRRLGIRTASGPLESVPEPVFRQANAGVA